MSTDKSVIGKEKRRMSKAKQPLSDELADARELDDLHRFAEHLRSHREGILTKIRKIENSRIASAITALQMRYVTHL